MSFNPTENNLFIPNTTGNSPLNLTGNNPFVHNSGQQNNLSEIGRNISFFEKFQAPQVVSALPRLDREVKIRDPESLDSKMAEQMQNAEIELMYSRLDLKAEIEKNDAKLALEMNDAGLAEMLQEKINAFDRPNEDEQQIKEAMIENDEYFALQVAKELSDAEEKQKAQELKDTKIAKEQANIILQVKGYILIENDLYYHEETEQVVKLEDIKLF
jgi:hypothetical protein